VGGSAPVVSENTAEKTLRSWSGGGLGRGWGWCGGAGGGEKEKDAGGLSAHFSFPFQVLGRSLERITTELAFAGCVLHTPKISCVCQATLRIGDRQLRKEEVAESWKSL